MPRSYAELKDRLATTRRKMRSKAGVDVFAEGEIIRVGHFDRWTKFSIKSLDGTRHLWKVERRDFVLCEPIETLDSRVLVYVDAHPGVTPAEVAKALEVKPPTVYAAVKRLWVECLLDRQKSGGYMVPLPKGKGTTWHDRLLASVNFADELTIK